MLKTCHIGIQDMGTSMIVFYVRFAFNIFSTIVNEMVTLKGFAFVNVIKACTTHQNLMHVHAYAIGCGPYHNLLSETLS